MNYHFISGSCKLAQRSLTKKQLCPVLTPFLHSAAEYHWLPFWELAHLLSLYIKVQKTAILIAKFLTAIAYEKKKKEVTN